MAANRQYRRNIKNNFDELRRCLTLEGNPSRNTIITEAIAALRALQKQNVGEKDSRSQCLRPPSRKDATASGINIGNISKTILNIGVSSAMETYVAKQYTEVLNSNPIMYNYGDVMFADKDILKQVQTLLPVDKTEYTDAIVSLLYCNVGKTMGYNKGEVYDVMFGTNDTEDLLEQLSQE